jgi:hypothetical protein
MPQAFQFPKPDVTPSPHNPGGLRSSPNSDAKDAPPAVDGSPPILISIISLSNRFNTPTFNNLLLQNTTFSVSKPPQSPATSLNPKFGHLSTRSAVLARNRIIPYFYPTSPMPTLPKPSRTPYFPTSNQSPETTILPSSIISSSFSLSGS